MLDEFAMMEGKSCDDLIRQAIQLYLIEKRRKDLLTSWTDVDGSEYQERIREEGDRG
jgi:hypothetical protein